MIACVECGSQPKINTVNLKNSEEYGVKYYSCSNPLCMFRYQVFKDMATWEDRMTRWGRAAAPAPTPLMVEIDKLIVPVGDYESGELVKAAQCYVSGNKRAWPWDSDFEKVSKRDGYVRAIVYLLNEVDRLDTISSDGISG